MLIKEHKIYLGIIALLFLFAALPTLSFGALTEKQAYRILNSLLADNFEVSFEAEELVIAFSDDGAPEINRYKIGRLMPSKRRRDTYRLDGSIKEIMVQDEDMQIVSYPDKKMVIKSRRKPDTKTKAISAKLVALVRQNYHLKSTGKEMVSGRSTIVIAINPKEKGTRPSFRVWIDHETGLPLKTETYSIDGKLSFLSILSGVVINPSFPQDYFVIMVPLGTKAYEPPVASLENVNKSKEKLAPGVSHALKGGYLLKETGLSDSGHIQSIYHDGINSVSVFTKDSNDVISGSTKKGDKSQVTLNNVKRVGFEGFFCNRGKNNILSFISGSHRHILVGEVSKKGLIDIAIDLKEGLTQNEN